MMNVKTTHGQSIFENSGKSKNLCSSSLKVSSMVCFSPLCVFKSQKQREASACDRVELVSSMAFFNDCPPGPEQKNESDDDNGDGGDDDVDDGHGNGDGDGEEDGGDDAEDDGHGDGDGNGGDDDHLVDEDCSSSLAR